jgi:hypothetical protein
VLPVNHRQTVHPNGTLTVENVQQKADQGTYTCQARNRQGLSDKGSVDISVMGKLHETNNPFNFKLAFFLGFQTFLQCLYGPKVIHKIKRNHNVIYSYINTDIVKLHIVRGNITAVKNIICIRHCNFKCRLMCTSSFTLLCNRLSNSPVRSSFITCTHV